MNNKNNRINDTKSKIIKNRNLTSNKPRSCSPSKTNNSSNTSVKYLKPQASQIRPAKFITKSNEQNLVIIKIKNFKKEKNLTYNFLAS